MQLTKEELHAALVARHGEAVQSRLDGASVGVAGLGGLGSNIAVHLARLGVGRLVLVDFDVVDVTNLNRQHYTMRDLGVPKAIALLEQLEAINPYLNYETYIERIIPANAARLFAGCDVVCEAFDRADQKAMLIETLLAAMPGTPLVSGSLYVCGDGTSDIADGMGLMAPRVAVCAAHQATAALRLLLGEEP